MKDHAIFCTAAENNSEYYLQRVRQWYNTLYPIYKDDTDFYVFVDGKIDDLPALKDCQFVCLTPKLGRSNIRKFEGYKRSFCEALKSLKNYEYLMLIENDVKILNFNNINEYRSKKGLYSSIDDRYHRIETALMILNDKDASVKMIDHYLNGGIFEDIDFEVYIQKNFAFKYPLKSIRVEGHLVNEIQYDFLAQISMTHFKGIY